MRIRCDSLPWEYFAVWKRCWIQGCFWNWKHSGNLVPVAPKQATGPKCSLQTPHGHPNNSRLKGHRHVSLLHGSLWSCWQNQSKYSLCTDSCRCQSGVLLPSRQDRQEANRYLRLYIYTWSACAKIWFVTWSCWKGLKFRISALHLFRHPKDSERFMLSRNRCKKWFTWLLYRNSQDLGLPCEVSAFQVWRQFQGSDAKVLAENFRGRPRVPCLKGLLSA